uniref:Uncharacterized protein n=1 Tax=Ditylenchus dipsaci TaxID=166011 RepID=A0A915D018_9BILA
MEQYVLQTDKYLQNYNCSKIKIDDVPLSMRQHTTKAIGTIIISAVAQVLYIPVTISIFNLMSNACYKLLFFTCILNCLILWILGFLHGILTFLGAVYCSYPNLIYLSGSVLSWLWLAESSTELFLVLNRCLAILSPCKEKVLFSGRRIFLWIFISVIYASYWYLFLKPVLFNAIYFTYFFNPSLDI